MDVNPNKKERSLVNLHRLLTKNMTFDDIDLVKNFAMFPDQITTLKNSKMEDLVFVSKNDELLLNDSTVLNNITKKFMHEWKRLRINYKSKEFAVKLNITFDEVVKLSNLSLDDFLDSKLDVFKTLRKTFFINRHLTRLQAYKNTLLSYNMGISIDVNMSLVMRKILGKLSVEKLEELNDETLKLLFVKQYKNVFIEQLTVKNISAFFNKDLSAIMTMTVPGVVEEILNITITDYASMYGLSAEQLDLLREEKLSSVENVELSSLAMAANSILTSRGKTLTILLHRPWFVFQPTFISYSYHMSVLR